MSLKSLIIQVSHPFLFIVFLDIYLLKELGCFPTVNFADYT